MPSAPKSSVRARLTLTILLAIFLSWVLSAGSFAFFARQELRAVARRHPIIRQLWQAARAGKTNVIVLPVPVGRGAFLFRFAIAVLLALAAGAWLSRRFTRPLDALADGAKAFHDGKLDHRISLEGDDEFTRVAASMNQMAGQVAAQLAELEADAHRRRQLLADVAHDLRSPIAAMKTTAEAMRDGLANTPERRELALASMVDTADRLQRLVTDLLDLARLDLHELPLHRQFVDLRALAAEVVHSRLLDAEQAGIILRPMPPGEPLPVDADPDRLAQVLDNLLDNAVSHAGQGAEVTVTLQENPFTITVADTGRGIAAEHLAFLFDPFYRADPARTPGTHHSGLGLRIARGIVEAHGGTLELESKEGEGTRVQIRMEKQAEAC
ncbi:MAG: sensor histidine kinase [Armatimonadota bacterium]